MLRRMIIPAIAGLFLTACQGSMVRSFESLQPGMDKHQVLESIGNPNSTTRLHGKDRWVYRFYDDGKRYDKEVHFMDGVLVFSGEYAPAPEKAAVAVDKRVEEKETAIQAEEKARDEERRNNANLFTEYEKEARGQDNKVRYLPAFVDLK